MIASKSGAKIAGWRQLQRLVLPSLSVANVPPHVGAGLQPRRYIGSGLNSAAGHRGSNSHHFSTQPTHTQRPQFMSTAATATEDDAASEADGDDSDNDPGVAASIYKANDPESIHPDLNQHIRCSLSGRNAETGAGIATDTGMSICFLGTSAGIPTRKRAPSATLLRLGGRALLFDVGEGVQRQCTFTRSRTSQIHQIFITHMHGDHIFGLPGFLLGLQTSGDESKTAQDHVVKIYGPVGLYNFIVANLMLSCSRPNRLTIEVYELIGSQMGPRRRHNHRSPFHTNYREFSHRNIHRKFIKPVDGVWTIEDYEPIKRSDLLDASKRSLMENKKRTRIQAAEMYHVPHVTTFGFTVQEEEPARNIDPAKAKALGVSPAGKKYELLKHGYSVYTDDGEVEVMPDQVLLPQTKYSRKITVVGDNAKWTDAMKTLAQNSDVLVHEATLLEEDKDLVERGHSTASMAGEVAAEVNAQVLVLTHVSSKADSSGQVVDLRKVAEEVAEDGVKTAVAHDFMELLVPWEGFHEADVPPSQVPKEGSEETVAGEEGDDGDGAATHQETTRKNDPSASASANTNTTSELFMESVVESLPPKEP